ncbi:bacteriophage abortive infection AbiH family protein [Sedimentibacter sp.]|uniref:bacteriophage abortive infection AbiH family protein n=1 Tax=Sedimentibacter sp. TaxID=1960295 RepID=UPI00289B703B|nr:bacteriophage abortive infection AbiH family protein [Sedimentibacter sp.]
MKNNLFIIGNGFDRSHDMPTSYIDFKNWLIEMYPDSINTDNFMVSYATNMPKGDMYIADEDLASFLVYCINETAGGNWENFEEALGNIDWESFFDDIEDITDKDGDTDFLKTAYAREDFTSTLSLNSRAFSDLFSRWINTISYPENISCNSFLTNSLKNSSIFLTFNYTKTLEDIYSIPPEQICHIHGTQNKNIIIGHGVKKFPSSAYSYDEYDFENNYESDYDYGMDGIYDIHNSLKKPTKQILKQTPFFSNLNSHNIDNIYSWGFSFSEVDLCYIKEICNILDTTNITWNLHDWRNKGATKFEHILRQCGFAGNITTFKS